MTIKEALKQRIPRIRRPMWHENSYIRLPLMANNLHGPWMELYDCDTQEHVLHIRPGSQREPAFGPETEIGDDFVAYTGPVSEFEKHPENFAKSYAEN